jgi:RNA polymerase sigma factor (sigma-70 family)
VIDKQTADQNSIHFGHILFANGRARTHYWIVPNLDDEFIPTRATLLQRLKNWEDQSSWQDFFETYWKFIYGVARKSGLSEDDAQDLVQETMVSVAKHMPNFKYDPETGSFKAWLQTLVRWRISDHVRKRAQTPGRVELSADQTWALKEIPDASQTLNQIYEEEWQKNLVEAAIAKVKVRLDPQKYQIFDFYVNKGWPTEKVATAFNISVSQVYLAKNRITEMIKAEVKRLETEML